MAGRGPRTPRAEKVAPLPLAGGGASANRLDLDTAKFRDKVVKDRATKRTLTVAEELAQTLGNLDTTPGRGGMPKAPLTAFTESLQQAFLEHQKNPGEGSLTPYREAFKTLLQDNPMKASEIIEAGRLQPELISALAFDDAPDAPEAPAVQVPATPMAPEQFGLRGTPVVDTDETIPFQPSTSPVPWSQFRQEDILPITESVQVYNPDAEDAGPMPTAGNVWLKKQADRGWRSVTYPPLRDEDGVPGAPRRVLEVLADKMPELMPTDPVPTQYNPTFLQERMIYQPVQQQRPLAGLTAGVEDPKVPIRDKIASLTPDQREAMLRAQDMQSALETGRQVTSQQEIAPNDIEGMMQVPLADEARDFDQTAQGAALAAEIARTERRYPILQGLIRNNPSAAPAPEGPAAAINRGQYNLSLAQLLGDADKAESYYFRDQVRPSRQLFPLMRQEHAIRHLATLSGRDYFPALPAESSTVGKLNKQFESKPVSEAPASRVVFDEESKSKKGRTGRVVYEIPDEKQPITEGSVGPYYDVGIGTDPNIAKALSIVDQNLMDNPKYDPSNPDAIDPKTGKPYPRHAIPMAMEGDVLGLLSQEGVPQSGRIIMRYGTSPNMSPSLERSIRAEDRGALTKLREQAIRTIEGEASGVPDVLAGLMDPKKLKQTRNRRVGQRGLETYADPVSSMDPEARAAAAEVLQRAVDQGGILNMHTLAPWATANYVFDGPDGQSMYFKLRPEHVAPLMAQALLVDNPNTIKSMVPMVARSMEVYDQIPPSGRARDFLDESGQPQFIRPTRDFLNEIFRMYQEEGVPLPDMYPMPDTPATPDVPMADNPQAGMTMPRFRQDQLFSNPVASLIG